MPLPPLRHFVLVLVLFSGSACTPTNSSTDAEASASSSVEPFDLDTLQARTFRYFWDLADETNYQVPDRYPTKNFSSIAATGFGLTSYLVGIHDGQISREAGAERVRNTLRVLWDLQQGPDSTGVSGYKGLFYHFLTYENATRFKNVELSTIDTGLLMAGILSTMSFFDRDNPVENDIRQLADKLYRRVEWDWALNDDNRISMGWRPERGFITHDWKGYNEAMVLLILAMGSPTHPIPASSWDTWCSTYEWADYYGYEHINFEPLFGHQYSQMYIDFRGIQDDYMAEKGIDYHENSRRAAFANRAYCMDNPHQFKGYSDVCWGLTACDGPANKKQLWKGDTIQFRTYSARGASAQRVVDDGTIAPTAAAASIAFAPEISLAAMEHFWTDHYDQLVRTYGYADAFNLTYTWGEGNENGWFDKDYIGIDQGPIVIQIENYQSGLVWDLMKKNPYVRAGLKRAGFRNGWIDENS